MTKAGNTVYRIKKGKVLSEIYNDERTIELNKIRQYYKEKTFSDFDITKEKDYDDAVNNLKSDQTIYDTDWFNNLIQEKLIYKTFKDYIEATQILQSKALETAISSHLKAQPKCMGTMLWQFNDCWPGVTWSIIDFYGNKKKAFYTVQKLYN